VSVLVGLECVQNAQDSFKISPAAWVRKCLLRPFQGQAVFQEQGTDRIRMAAADVHAAAKRNLELPEEFE